MSAEHKTTIRNEPCDCPPDRCAHFVEPYGDCINRRTGDVVTAPCKACSPHGFTWHQDGRCLRCEGKAKGLVT